MKRLRVLGRGVAARRGIGLVSVALVTASCSGRNGPAAEAERRVGVIEYYGDTAAISVPAVATVGEMFTIVLHTFGNSCVSKDHTRVHVDQNVVTVTPHDVYALRETCTDSVTLVDHTTWPWVERPGYTTVIIRGRVEPGGRIEEKTYSVLVGDKAP
jgi:hypothetical protein